ncbi:hypothetical protein CW751_12230 [Brumimicrobium salinarum]|uniref:Uncharacterized protein n=1 Tax=Brumimicrobium salinarum TaxID=2058658 RepID=A0A2I0R072_9FLAO|nr:hypothetical protein [Brumimicrobium salinarum]PKR79986.1 hypothetical protein CW751_12230 [Brumimicrobium salinarum]
MELQELKKPIWKIKQEKRKQVSFDEAFEQLGANGEFLNAKKIKKEIISPTQRIKLHDQIK